MNSFVRTAIRLTGAVLLLAGSVGTMAYGRNSRPTAAQPPPVIRIVEIQTQSESPQDTHSAVYTGEWVQVKFNKALDKVHLRVDAQKDWILLQKTERDTVWKLAVPASLSAPNVPASQHIFAFYGSLASAPTVQLFCGSRAMTVYPPPNARVDGIVQRVLNPKISDAEYLTVNGQGFFAPLEKIKLLIGGKEAINKAVSADGKHLYAEFNPQELSGTQPVQLIVWDTYAAVKDGTAGQLQVEKYADELWSLGIAVGAFLLVALLIVALANPGHRMRLPRPLENILLEKPNNTYSLSCFQFYWWSGILGLTWLFVFAARGILANDWHFPGLAGFASTFFISLCTLIIAQAVNAVRGVKGSGTVHPSLSDLLMHGGVAAPERVQHFTWTVLSGIVFIVIIYKSYQTTAVLPVIPNGLLVLMGLSALGYLGGKLARKPGPIISQITTKSSQHVQISGYRFSVKSRIWLNGVELPTECLAVAQPDPQRPHEFASAIQISLPQSGDFVWYNPTNLASMRTITLMNADGQISDWSGIPSPPERAAERRDAAPPEPDSAGSTPHLPQAVPVIISTPPEKIMPVVYGQSSSLETDPERVAVPEQNGTTPHTSGPATARRERKTSPAGRGRNSDEEPLSRE